MSTTYDRLQTTDPIPDHWTGEDLCLAIIGAGRNHQEYAEHLDALKVQAALAGELAAALNHIRSLSDDCAGNHYAINRAARAALAKIEATKEPTQ